MKRADGRACLGSRPARTPRDLGKPPEGSVPQVPIRRRGDGKSRCHPGLLEVSHYAGAVLDNARPNVKPAKRSRSDRAVISGDWKPHSCGGGRRGRELRSPFSPLPAASQTSQALRLPLEPAPRRRPPGPVTRHRHPRRPGPSPPT